MVGRRSVGVVEILRDLLSSCVGMNRCHLCLQGEACQVVAVLATTLPSALKIIDWRKKQNNAEGDPKYVWNSTITLTR